MWVSDTVERVAPPAVAGVLGRARSSLAGWRAPVLAVALAACAEAELAMRADASSGPRVVGVVAGLGLLALAAAEARPLAVLALLVALAAVQAALHGALLGSLTPLAAVAVAALAAGRALPARWLPIVAALAACGLTLANQLGPLTPTSTLSDLAFFGALVVGAPMLVGHGIASRSHQEAELLRRISALARGEELALAAARADERARLARGVEEAVARRLDEIAALATGAGRLAESGSDLALEMLAGAETGARASLHELREVIGILREPEPEPEPKPKAAT